MDKNLKKKYVIISGFNLRQNNRGNSALSYGAISFLKEKGWLASGQELVLFRFYKNPFRKVNLSITTYTTTIDGMEIKCNYIPVFVFYAWLSKQFGILLPFTRFKRIVNQIAYEAADYGGDGFSDIYGDRLFKQRFYNTLPLWKLNIPLIVLPQTIGPFSSKRYYDFAIRVLRHAKYVFVRDAKFEKELKQLDIKYEQAKDLSAYMKPQPFSIEIKPNAIGINVSGLAYSNRFVGLENQFDAYPELIDALICYFRDKGNDIYLIPHSYCYASPEPNNDDLVACREAYSHLKDKSNVVVVDKDMIAPEVKYVISKMKFFIGTRMHANFAAIYTGVPLFGLAYSYKFVGAFNANGLDGEKQTSIINNISPDQIQTIVQKVANFYSEVFNVNP